jgi:hypothetical protein
MSTQGNKQVTCYLLSTWLHRAGAQQLANTNLAELSDCTAKPEIWDAIDICKQLHEMGQKLMAAEQPQRQKLRERTHRRAQVRPHCVLLGTRRHAREGRFS